MMMWVRCKVQPNYSVQNIQLQKNHQPHSVCRTVSKIPVELRHTEHGLCEDSHKTDRLDEDAKVCEEVHEDAAHHRHAYDELHVGLKVSPLPEEAKFEVCVQMERQGGKKMEIVVCSKRGTCFIS